MDERPFPPSPSPPPRLRRSPKRTALQEVSNSEANEISFPSIRPVTDTDAKVYATSPFPATESQVLLPAPLFDYAPPAASRYDNNNGANNNGGHPSNNGGNGKGKGKGRARRSPPQPPVASPHPHPHPRPHPGRPNTPGSHSRRVSRSNTPSATQKAQVQVLRDENTTTTSTSTTVNTPELLNISPPRLLHPAASASARHDHGILASASPDPSVSSSSSLSSPLHRIAALFSPVVGKGRDHRSTKSTSLGAERLAMDRGLYEDDDDNNYREHAPPPPPPNAQQIADGLRQHPVSFSATGAQSHAESSNSPSTPARSRATLGAIASAASRASRTSSHNDNNNNNNTRTPARAGSASVPEGTPMSGFSVDSAGTVVRRRGYTGPNPPGFYSLFPPAPQVRPGSLRRRNSDPAAPGTGSIEDYDLSPASSGSPGSPVSPISGEEEGFDRHAHESFYVDATRTRSDPLLVDMGSGSQDVRYPVVRPSPSSSGRRRSRHGSGRNFISPQDASHNFHIPRRPVGQRQSGTSSRWRSGMSTIPSESAGDRTSSGQSYGAIEPSNGSSSLGADLSSFPAPATSPPTSRHGKQPERDQQRRRRSEGQQEEAGPSSRYSLQNSLAAAVAMAADRNLPPLPELQRPQRQRKLTPPLSAYLPQKTRESVLSPQQERASLSVPKPELKRNSGSSFFLDAIPAWARTYYAHEARNRQTIGARPNSTSPEPRPGGARARRNTFSPSHNRPESLRIPPPGQRRNNRRPDFLDEYRDEMAISPLPPTHQPREQARQPRYERQSQQRRSTQPTYHYDPDVRGGPRVVSGNPLDRGDWSPRLIHNRVSTVKRRTVFIAPSIDESIEARTGVFSRRNVQVWSFVVGFVFPFAWIVAAWLPLPQKPRDSLLVTPGFEQDLEKAFTGTDVARYENARWWRNINRIMSPVGWLIIIAVVALVVVTVRSG